jgi:hypothetical protein
MKMHFELFGFAVWKEHFSINIFSFGYRGIFVLEIDSDIDYEKGIYLGKIILISIFFMKLLFYPGKFRKTIL